MPLLCAEVQGSRCQGVELFHIVVLQLQSRKRYSDSIAKRSYWGFFYKCCYKQELNGESTSAAVGLAIGQPTGGG